MDSSLKDKTGASADFCGLYCFPEFTSDEKQDDPTSSEKHSFVGGAAVRQATDPNAADPAHSSPVDTETIEKRLEEAFQKGLEQGRLEAEAIHRAKVDRASSALSSVVDEIRHMRQLDVARMEKETVRLALAISRKIIHCESEHGATIRRVVKMALQKVADPRNMIIRLNPKDMQTIQAFQSELLIGDDVSDPYQIEADDSILQGGCMIETKLGDVDARIDRQIRIVEEQLTAHLPKSPVKEHFPNSD